MAKSCWQRTSAPTSRSVPDRSAAASQLTSLGCVLGTVQHLHSSHERLRCALAALLLLLVLSMLPQVAIKQLERPHLVLRYVESELVNHSQLRHPHVVQFREVFLTDEHVSVCRAQQPAYRTAGTQHAQHAGVAG